MIKGLNILSKFFSAGLVATGIHASTYAWLIYYLSLSSQVANLAAYVSAVAISYLLQMKWTFSSRKDSKDASFKSFSKFLAVSLFGFSLNVTFVFFVENIFELDPLFALVGIVVVTPILTFTLLNYWVFPKLK